MVDGLLDTSIIIDLLRDHEPALAWSSSSGLRAGLTHFVWLEIIQGAKSNEAQRKATRVLQGFPIVQFTAADVTWALRELTRVVPSHNGIGALDALIAATAFRLQIPLYTGNIKHMQPLLGSLAHKPY